MDQTSMPPKAEQTSNHPVAESQNTGVRTIEIAGNRIESRDLFVGTKEITIGHVGEVYRLRLTALNKLILTK
jgi:hemin uptake protein HemP